MINLVRSLLLSLVFITFNSHGGFWKDLKKYHPTRIAKIRGLIRRVDSGLMPGATTDEIIFTIAILSFKKNVPAKSSTWDEILDSYGSAVPLMEEVNESQ